MKLRTHYLIAGIAADNSGLSGLKKFLFCVGALLPDLSVMQFFYPHFYKRSGEYVFRKLEDLSGSYSLLSVLELGKMAHYCSDFCCKAHIGGGIGCVKEHVRYERELNDFAEENFHRLYSECMKTSAPASLKALLNEYYSRKDSDFQNDFVMAVKASSAVCALAAGDRRSVCMPVAHNTDF